MRRILECVHFLSALKLQLRGCHSLLEHCSPSPSCEAGATWPVTLLLVFPHISFLRRRLPSTSPWFISGTRRMSVAALLCMIDCLLMGKISCSLGAWHPFFHFNLKSVGLLYGMKLNTSIYFCFIRELAWFV